MALSVKKFLTIKNITGLRHPPYSPDWAPCDFFFRSYSFLAEREPILPQMNRFEAKTENLLKELPKTSFQNYYQQWQHRILNE
ncbi:hypothetical protein TNCV_2965561 [Trichonephila clavipes]|nr:hypothetical protein TNCV_2965561 [Trichonephila clavipes]